MSIHATSLPSANLSYVIASVYNKSATLQENKGQTRNLQAQLERENIPHALLEGGYRHTNGEFVFEQSFLFPVEYWPRFAPISYDQESVLVLGPLPKVRSQSNRRATLHYLDGRLPVDLGWFTQVSLDTARANKAGFTYDLKTEQYFITEL